jgi:competence protein ComEA
LALDSALFASPSRALRPQPEQMQMPQISRGRALAYVAALLVALVVAGRLAFRHDSTKALRPAVVAMRAAPAPARKVLVHVVGAVREPGLYRLDDGSRVDDAIRAAGGAKPKAALELVNLAAPVADGQQVIVPLLGKAAAGGAAVAPGAPPQPVHLNSATLEDLDTLPGVGPVTAQKILDYRTEHGAFSSVDELDSVPGIGPARLAELRKLVDL